MATYSKINIDGVEYEVGLSDEEYAKVTAAVSNEDTRNSNETTRIANENTRKSNEEARQAAEGAIANKTGRAYAESLRVSAENTRATAEKSRVAAETLRAEKDSKRDIKYENGNIIITKYDASKTNKTATTTVNIQDATKTELQKYFGENGLRYDTGNESDYAYSYDTTKKVHRLVYEKTWTTFTTKDGAKYINEWTNAADWPGGNIKPGNIVSYTGSWILSKTSDGTVYYTQPIAYYIKSTEHAESWISPDGNGSKLRARFYWPSTVDKTYNKLTLRLVIDYLT